MSVQPNMLEVVWARGNAAPLVLDSPHSGTIYPDDFAYIVPQQWLRQTEDSFVDDLFSFAPKHGVTLLKAHFTRSYIDVNRAVEDLDPEMVTGHLPFHPQPTERSTSGYGLIRHLCRGQAVYTSRLTAQEIMVRIETCHAPYHATLKKMLDDIHAQFGAVWHVNCHSMPSQSAAKTRPDFVIGDRDGASAAPEFSHVLAQYLREAGYSIAFNDPYKGVEILKRYGHPHAHRHSLQLEINRALYMNEETLQPSAHYSVLKRDLEKVLLKLKDWTLGQCRMERMAAE